MNIKNRNRCLFALKLLGWLCFPSALAVIGVGMLDIIDPHPVSRIWCGIGAVVYGLAGLACAFTAVFKITYIKEN